MTDTTHRHHSHTEAYRRGDQSPEALEHEIDEERRSVSTTLEALQEKMSVGSMVDEVWRNFGHYGTDFGRGLGRRVAENPLPLILTGVGLAWLMASSGRSRRNDHYEHDEDYLWEADDDLYEEDFVGTRRYGASGMRPYGTAPVAGPYSRRESSGTGERLRGTASSMSHRARSAAGSASHAAGSAAHRAGDTAGSAYGSASHAAGSAAHRAGDAASSAYGSASHAAGSAAHRAGGMASSAYGSAAHAAGSASHYAGGAASSAAEGARGAAGAISRAAGSAYSAAGEAAETARRQAAHYGRNTQRRMDDMMDEHPLVMGALALAVGAAIGGALPRTRVEDEYVGEYSEEAWEMARDEAEKARRVAGAVYDEARHIAEEEYEKFGGRARSLAEEARSEAGSAAQRLRDKATEEAQGVAERAREEAKGAAKEAKSDVREAGSRLSETAREEAKKQDLGHPGKHS